MVDITSTNVQAIYPARLVTELALSGLVPGDMRVRPITPAEKAATGAPMGADGYVIPYFGLDGKPVPFYRVKLWDSTVKYRQIIEQPNHIYFPPRLLDVLSSKPYLLLCEGEKKAAAAVKAGFPCVAVSGVDSWKSRTINLPKDVAIAQKPNGMLSVRLPAGANIQEGQDTVALGFQALVDYILQRKIPIIICYDSDIMADGKAMIKPEVQRAAATLGFELRFRGLPMANIRQLVLPNIGADKTGLDDLLESDDGVNTLTTGISDCLLRRSAFPRHPNIRDYINRKLQRAQMPRSDQLGVALATLADLDARGQRLRSPDEGSLYYFSSETKSLDKVLFTGRPEFAETPFGRFLYREYGLGPNDQRILGWLSSQYSGEEPIAQVYPEKVMAWRGDTLYFQVNNGSMAKVTKNSVTFLDNGEDGVLFEAGMIAEADTKDVERYVKVAQAAPIQNWWYDVLRETRIRDTAEDRQRKLLSLLYYVSPLFYRWRGTQLPVEITTGEAGSGKSTLYELRLSILTGVPTLRNAPTDLRDWNASLASTGALHVTDNVAFTEASLRQRMSDEICRLVTEPKPSIEQRKLYTDTTIVKIPVNVVFALTAIRQPFTNIDIIQRAIITDLDKGTSADLKYDAQWKEHQLANKGGRCSWLAHQLVFVQRMLRQIDTNWEPRYQARYRLINVEQLLKTAANIFNMDPSWIPFHLESVRDMRATETDWTLQGLVAYSSWMRSRLGKDIDRWTGDVNAIANWAQGEDEFMGCKLLIDPRQLTRYLNQHKHTVATSVGLVPLDETAGKAKFRLREIQPNN